MRAVGLSMLMGWAVLLAQSETPARVASQALRRMEAKDFQTASLALRSFLGKSPGHPDLWNLLGICESELSNTAAARNAFETGLRLDPSFLALNENLGFLYFRQENYADAKRYLSTAVTAGSRKPGVVYSLAASEIRTGEQRRGLELLNRLEPQLASEADYWAERGWVELRDSPERAASSFDRALAIDPDHQRALNGAASAAETENQDDKALSFLLRARKAHPNDVRTLLHFASVCLRKGLPVDALPALERARTVAPGNHLALFLLARTQIAFERWQDSHNLFSEYDRRVPDSPFVQYALGWLDLRLNRTDEAREHLRRSLALAPDHADAQYELGQLDLNQGHLRNAESHLEAALRIEPRHAKARTAMGDLLFRKGDIAGARQQYEDAIDADPRSGAAHYKLSAVLARMNETERASAERALGATLNAEATKAGKTIFVLADPTGTPLTDESAFSKGNR